jgi:hypothetical protein
MRVPSVGMMWIHSTTRRILRMSTKEVGLLDEDYARLGLAPPKKARNALRAALDAAIPGNITDDDINAIAEFLKVKMNEVGYPLLFSTKRRTPPTGTIEMIGGTVEELALLTVFLTNTVTQRLERARINAVQGDEDDE